ncbi:hypothetical protein [Limosilactobacillus vaginalis]
MLDYLHDNQIKLVPYFPLASGLLTVNTLKKMSASLKTTSEVKSPTPAAHDNSSILMVVDMVWDCGCSIMLRC